MAALSTLQIIVVVSTIFISLATFLLSSRLLIKYRKTKLNSYLFWGLGISLFGAAALLEVIFALNIYSTILIDLYLFIVVLVVQFLSIGSMQMVKEKMYRYIYYLFSAAIALLAFLSIVYTNQGYLIQNYVVAGLPTISVIITSTIATVASSIVIVALAILSYLKKRSNKMLSIIAGVVVVACAGTLYIASFPELLYYAEFLGTLLLWFGFS